MCVCGARACVCLCVCVLWRKRVSISKNQLKFPKLIFGQFEEKKIAKWKERRLVSVKIRHRDASRRCALEACAAVGKTDGCSSQ